MKKETNDLTIEFRSDAIQFADCLTVTLTNGDAGRRDARRARAEKKMTTPEKGRRVGNNALKI